jgi:6-phosphofructokinase 2
MIYTVTLNPALDRTIEVDQIRCDVANRIIEEHWYPGGKGVDVSRVLTTLGVETMAFGFIGGFRGDQLEAGMITAGIGCDFIRIAGETRSNLVIHEQLIDKQVLLNSRGPEVEPSAMMALLRKIRNLHNPGLLTIGGSLPPNLKPSIYRTIVEIVQDRGGKALLDADGAALKTGIEGKPYAIKPNLHELSELVNRPLNSFEEIFAAAQEPLEAGVKVVLASLGPDGILLVSKDLALHAIPPTVEVKNTIGAGDSAVAGFLYALEGGKDLSEALTYAVAAGTATTMRSGTALGRREDIMALVQQVQVKKIPLPDRCPGQNDPAKRT